MARPRHQDFTETLQSRQIYSRAGDVPPGANGPQHMYAWLFQEMPHLLAQRVVAFIGAHQAGAKRMEEEIRRLENQLDELEQRALSRQEALNDCRRELADYREHIVRQQETIDALEARLADARPPRPEGPPPARAALGLIRRVLEFARRTMDTHPAPAPGWKAEYEVYSRMLKTLESEPKRTDPSDSP